MVLAVFCHNSLAVYLCLAASRLISREMYVRWPSFVFICVVALSAVVVAKVAVVAVGMAALFSSSMYSPSCVEVLRTQ